MQDAAVISFSILKTKLNVDFFISIKTFPPNPTPATSTLYIIAKFNLSIPPLTSN